ncbi:MAG TPA: hypothetical protein VGF45_21055 [Polyangia bacterium]
MMDSPQLQPRQTSRAYLISVAVGVALIALVLDVAFGLTGLGRPWWRPLVFFSITAVFWYVAVIRRQRARPPHPEDPPALNR